MQTYQVFIKNLKTHIRCGVFEDEKHAPQEVIVNVTLTAQKQQNPQTLEDVADYSRIANTLSEDWPNRPHQDLLETWANDLLKTCLEDPQIIEATVSLTKTAPYPQAEGVGIEVSSKRNTI